MPQTPRYQNVTTATRESITFDTADPRYKLARKVDTGSGSYGSTSPFRDPRRLSGSADTNNRFRGKDPGFGRGSWNWSGDGVEEASRRSTNKAVTVEARTVPGSTRQTLGNRARVAASNAVDRVGKGVSAAKGSRGGGGTVSNGANSAAKSSAASSASSAVGAIGRTVSGSASGGTSVGAYKGGLGVGVSRGGLDLGVGFASVSYNFSNPNESSIGGAFNTLTITGTQEGCTIFLDYKFLGKTYFTETRQADQCEQPEPQPKTHPPGSDPDPVINNDETLPPGIPSPGTASTESRTTSTTSYSFAEPVLIFVSGETRAKRGRGSAYGEATYSLDIYGYIATLREFTIEEAWIYKTIPFWTEDGKYSGILFYSYQNYVIYPTGNDYPAGNISKVFWNVAWGKYTEPPENNFIVFFSTHQGENEAQFTNIFSPKSRHPTRPDYNEIKEYAGTFYRTPYRSNSKLIFYPLSSEQTLPKRTIITPRGVKKPVDNRQQILLERVYQMLGGDTFWENGLAVPNQMFTPEGEGYTRTKSYNGVAHLLFDTLDHRTPGQVEYKLPNGMEYKSINAQGYFQDLGANVAETLEETKKKESNNGQVMNYLTRNSFLNSQILKILIQTNRMVRAILSFLNVPVGEQVENVDIPFDMSLGGKLGRKGFGSPKEMDQELEKLFQEQLKSDPKGEKIAAEFGNNGKTKITTVKVRESEQGGDFWWFIKQQLGGK